MFLRSFGLVLACASLGAADHIFPSVNVSVTGDSIIVSGPLTTRALAIGIQALSLLVRDM